MHAHLRANLLLLGLTLALGSVLYPLAVLAVAQTLFPFQAHGSLIGADGKPAGPGEAVGSRLIGQAFQAPEHFHPRPSHAGAGYDAAASGGSNWAASNPLLRGRAARLLAMRARYASGPKAGQSVGPDIEEWFRRNPALVATWAREHPSLASAWVASDELYRSFVAGWSAAHPEVLADWREANPGSEPDAARPEDLAVSFFTSFARAHPGTWPSATERKTARGAIERQVRPAREGADIQATFFDLWLREHPQARLEPVAADAVTASGSGLDPHITLENARQQLDRVAAAWTSKTGGDPSRIRGTLEAVLDSHAFAPLGGLAGGEPLVNVLEVNLTLRESLLAPETR